LKRLLTDRPSQRVIESVVGVADDEAVVLLARAGRARLDLAPAVLTTLDDIDTPRAASVGSRLRSHLAGVATARN
jgi:hypothetical protein